MTNKPVTAMSVKIIAKITSFDDGQLRGTLDSLYFEKPHTFSGVVEMIDIMETTFDALGFPDKALLPRTFGKAEKRMRRHEMDLNKMIEERKRGVKGAKPDSPDILSDVLAVFEIFVAFRLNAEWQGKLHYINTDEEAEFSSIVELMKLIDNALS